MISTPASRPKTAIPVKPSAASLPEIKSNLNQAGDAFSDSLKQLRIAADAQVNIWTMKVSRAIFVTALGIPMLGAFLALMVFGFVLLNQAFALSLETTDMPPWYSPLIRGAIYFGIPAIALAIVWWNSAGGMPHTRQER